MSNYQGKPVTVVRNAQQGDPNFDGSKAQVIIKNADGSQNTVLKTDVQT
jgi:hypothetical protein